MAGFDRTTYIKGPAIVTHDSQTYYSEGDIRVTDISESFDISSAVDGKIDERLKSAAWEIAFTPVGEVEAAAKYFPWNVDNIGENIFGATDLTVAVQSKAGQLETWANGAVIRMPVVNLSAQVIPFAEMRILCLNKKDTDRTTEGAFMALTANAFSNTDFDETKILTPGYTAAYGGSPYAEMNSISGFVFDAGMVVRPEYVDRFGQIGATITGFNPTVRFTPTGLTMAQWDTLVAVDGANAVEVGASFAAAGGTDLIINKAAGNLKVTLFDAGIRTSGNIFGNTASRFSELLFIGKQTYSSGVRAARFQIEIE